MTNKPDVEKWKVAAQFADKQIAPGNCSTVQGSCVAPHKCTCNKDADAAVTGFLRAAASDGYRLVRVPDERRVGGRDWLRGANALRAEILASAVEVGE